MEDTEWVVVGGKGELMPCERKKLREMRDQLMNLPVFIGQMLEEAKRFLKKNDCMENIYIYIYMKGAAKLL